MRSHAEVVRYWIGADTDGLGLHQFEIG